MRVAVDTNVLAYAEGINGVERRDLAVDLIARIPVENIVVPVQVLGELFSVLRRKTKFSERQARAAAAEIADTFEVADTTAAVLAKAADLAADHHFGIWDAVILCASAQAGCRLLLSEDMQDGFTWNGSSWSIPLRPNRIRC